MKKQKSKYFRPSSGQDQKDLIDLPFDVRNQILTRLEYKDFLSLGFATQKNYQLICTLIKKQYIDKVSEEKANKYGVTYLQIHYSINSKTCVHCNCNEKKRKQFFVAMIQTQVCSKCMKEKEQYRCIVKTQAKKEWYLDESDLENLVSFQKKNVGYYMNLYFLTQIEEKAHEKYGGQQKFEEYREQRVEKYIQRRNKVEENRDLRSDRELEVKKYYNQYCYTYIKFEDISQIQKIKKYIKTNVPKNEKKRHTLLEQVKEKLDKIDKYQDTQIKQQYEIIKQYDINCQSQRRELIVQLLSIYGLNLREDSRLCRMFISDDERLQKSIYEIIEIMRRKSFLHGQTLYPEYQLDDYYSWRNHQTEQQCEQKALQQWITNNQQDTTEYPYTIQLEFLQYVDV